MKRFQSGVVVIQGLPQRIAARTVDDLWNAITDTVDIFTPSECRNFFTATGYEPE